MRKVWPIAVAIVAAALVGLFAREALAQASPFAVGSGPMRPPAPGGLMGFILAKQAEFYRALGAMIRQAKVDGTASLGLVGISFAYGIFHAAGPGHGKAVISSYLVANDETWRRGIVLSFASALLQSLVAVAIVGVAAALLQATAKTMCDTGRVIEMVSYALIIAVGARLVFVKGRGFLGSLRDMRHEPAPAPVGAAVTPEHDHHHDHERRHDARGHHGHIAHAEGEHCGHTHGPALEDLAGPGGWRRGLSAILAVGLRPCSGAILVLVFALAQGLFWVGVVSTFVMGLGTAITVAAIATLAVGARAVAVRLASRRSGFGTVAVRGIEVAAAALVMAFGSLLLAGYMMNERLVGLCG